MKVNVSPILLAPRVTSSCAIAVMVLEFADKKYFFYSNSSLENKSIKQGSSTLQSAGVYLREEHEVLLLIYMK